MGGESPGAGGGTQTGAGGGAGARTPPRPEKTAPVRGALGGAEDGTDEKDA